MLSLRKSRAKSWRKDRRFRSLQFQPLEERALLAIDTAFEDGRLTISSDADDDFAVRIEDGNVKIDGAAPSADQIARESVTKVDIEGGPESQVIDLSGFNRETFAGIEQLTFANGPWLDPARVEGIVTEILGPGWANKLGIENAQEFLTGGDWKTPLADGTLAKQLTDAGWGNAQGLLNQIISESERRATIRSYAWGAGDEGPSFDKLFNGDYSAERELELFKAASASSSASNSAFEPLTGDINGDGRVGPEDYTLWANTYGETGEAMPSDLNADGTVDDRDYHLLRANWGYTSEPVQEFSAFLDGGEGGGGGEPNLLFDNAFVFEPIGTSDTGIVNVRFRLDATTNVDVEFDWATLDDSAISAAPDLDFVAASGAEASGTQARIDAGDWFVDIPITVNGDDVEESTERFFVAVSNVTNVATHASPANALITDTDGIPDIFVDDITWLEPANSGDVEIKEVQVRLSHPYENGVTFNWQATPGTANFDSDYFYTPPIGSGQIMAGELATMLQFQIKGDDIDELNETFSVDLDQVNGANVGDLSAVATILDNDLKPEITILDATVTEGVGATADFVVQMSHPSSQNIQIDFTTSSPATYTATKGTGPGDEDYYDPATLSITFPASETQPSDQIISIPINDDSDTEFGAETFLIDLTAVGNLATFAGGDNQAVGSIFDNEPHPVVDLTYLGPSGNGGAADESAAQFPGLWPEVKLSIDFLPPSGDVTVSWMTVDGTAEHIDVGTGDYDSRSGVVTFTSGTLEHIVDFEYFNDSINEVFHEEFFVVITDITTDNADLGVGQVAVLIEDNDSSSATLTPGSIDVAAGSPTGTVIGQMQITSADLADDDGPPRYSITDVTSFVLPHTFDGAFEIESETGEIFVTNSAQIVDLPHGSIIQGEVRLEITAFFPPLGADPDGLTVTKNVWIEIFTPNNRPVIADDSKSVSEGALPLEVVYTVMPVDSDDSAFTFAILDDPGPFQIDSMSGEISLAPGQSLDAETQSSYVLRVSATDDGTPQPPAETGEGFITINVTGIDEAPVVENRMFGLPENSLPGTVVGSAATLMLDEGDIATYEIFDGDTNVFEINSSTGDIIVRDGETLNFEDGLQPFDLTVRVTDSNTVNQFFSDANITINVDDVNEAPTIDEQTLLSIREDSDYDTPVDFVAAGDPDNDSLRYAITGGNEAGIFAIDVVTGQVVVSNPDRLDYETATSHDLWVTVTDDGEGTISSGAKVTIPVDPVNEAPEIEPGQAFSIRADAVNGDVIGDVQATDPEGDNLTFSILSGHAGEFQIDSAGRITIDTTVPLGSQGTTYNLLIQATEVGAGGLQDSEIVTVTVNPVAPPTITLTATVRDFLAEHSDFQNDAPDSAPPGAPHGKTVLEDLVLNTLGADGTPVLNPERELVDTGSGLEHSIDGPIIDPETMQPRDTFYEWFHDVPDINKKGTVELVLDQSAPGSLIYTFIDNSFFPLSDSEYNFVGDSFPEEFPAFGGGNEKFHFTLELHAEFTYRPGQTLTLFNADDDLWVFINNELVINLGGLHRPYPDDLDPTTQDPPPEFLDLDGLGLIAGQTYPFDLFFAERHTGRSTLNFQTSIADLTSVSPTIDLIEENRFLTTNETPADTPIPITVPENAVALTLNYEDLSFDTDDPASINDAFEVALVDAQGNSLVPTLGEGRVAFFNFTEEHAALSAKGSGHLSGTADPDATTFSGVVAVDVRHLPTGTEAFVVTRLVNNDGIAPLGIDDTSTQVTIDPDVRFTFVGDFPEILVPEVDGWPPEITRSAEPFIITPRATPRNADFSVLSDVSAGFTVDYGRTSFNEASDILYVDADLTSGGQHTIRFDQQPVLVGVTNISQPLVRLHEPDGTTPEGMPYYVVTPFVDDADGDQLLETGETIGRLELRFRNPIDAQTPTGVQFDYDLVVLGAINQGPEFDTLPITDARAGKPYEYNSLAVDPEADDVTYSVMVGPAGLDFADPANGQLTWAAAVEGSYPVVIRATDSFGAFTDQPFTLDVVNVANGPPRFTSIPIVDAFAGVEYEYQADAEDPDFDDLTYSLISIMEDPDNPFNVPTTGLATWTPTVAEIGSSFDVELLVDDGNGGTDTQPYTIRVHPDPANRPPVFTTLPRKYFELAGDRDVARGDVSPPFIRLNLDPGEMATEEDVTITLPVIPPTPLADIIFVVDESVSMTGEHGWIDGTPGLDDGLIHQLHTALTDAGIDPRYGLVGFGDVEFVAGHSHLFEPQAGVVEFWATTPEGFVNDRQEPLVLDGSTEDGYEAIDFALTYPFRENAAVNIILLTDEDRDVLDPGLGISKDSIRQALQDAKAQLNVIVNASYDLDPAPFLQEPTLGVIGLPEPDPPDPAPGPQTSFVPGSPPAYFTSTMEDATLWDDFGETASDYVELAWELGGATWDLNQLREGGNVAIGFTNALVTTMETEILNQFEHDIILVPNDLGVTISTDPDDVLGVMPGGMAEFDVTFTGTLLSQGFDLEFRDKNFGYLLGSIPVSINDDYDYDTNAKDPDGDPVTFTLVDSPPWASMDNETSGIITGMPPGPGFYDFLIHASDGRGGEEWQPFTLEVAFDPNEDPVIHSVGPTEVTAGTEYYYAVDATDGDEDVLSYSLGVGTPIDVSIDPATGVVTWDTDEGDVGERTITIVVEDRRGGTATEVIPLNVVTTIPVNTDPEFDSIPVEIAYTEEPYIYRAHAFDPDPDRVVYDLLARPLGMEIDPDSGIIYWTPTESQVGETTVVVRAFDGRGWDIQSFPIEVVSLNEDPEIESIPDSVTKAGIDYTYQVEASDPNGDDPIFFVDPFSQSRGIMIDLESGLLTWPTPPAGSYHITVFAADLRGGVDDETFELLVGSNSAPDIDLIPGAIVPLGTTYTSQMLVFSDAEDPEDPTVTLDADSVARGMQYDEGTKTLSWTPRQEGDYRIRVTVEDDDGAKAFSEFSILVVDPSLPNRPPEITSEPRGPAFVNRTWTYLVTVKEPDGNDVTFDIDQASKDRGATIDSVTGELTWQPTQPGLFEIVVTATDDGDPNLSDTRRVFLPVNANLPPYVTNWPTGSIALDQQFPFTFEADDVNGDPFTFSLEDTTGDMTIHPDSGDFMWTPTSVGTFAFHVVVTETGGFGASSKRLVELDVIQTGPNSPPIVDAAHRGTIQAGQTYVHQIKANDPDGDPLSFTLVSSVNNPAGLSVSPSGMVTWPTTEEDVTAVGSPKQFTVHVTDVTGIPVPVNFSVNVTLEPAPNSAPMIDSDPIEGAVVGEIYRYQPTANDEDDDTIIWSLDERPAGLEIDELTGRLTWAPGLADLPFVHPVVLRASDPYGKSDTQPFEITVRSTNLPPQIFSVAPTGAPTGQQFIYEVDVRDPEGDPITLMLSDEPLGMDEDGLSIRWDVPVVGTYDFTIAASTPDGQSAEETAHLVVTNNQRPKFTTDPVFYAVEDELYEYDADAVDLDMGDTVSYELLNATLPGTYNFDMSSGMLTWDVPLGEAGNSYFIEILATDGQLGEVQRYPLMVEASNAPPSIALPTPIVHKVGTDFFFDVSPFVTDTGPTDDFITYAISFPGTIPEEMEIDERTGQITWPAAKIELGSYAVTVEVTDKFGESDSQTTTIFAIPDNSPPLVALRASDEQVFQGAEVTFFVDAVDDVGIRSRTLTVIRTGSPAVAYDVGLNGQITLPFTIDGTYTVTASATDLSGQGGISSPLNLTVDPVDPSNASPLVAITGPYEFSVIDQPFEVFGSVRDPDHDIDPNPELTDPVTYTVRLFPIVIGSGIAPAPIELGTFSGRKSDEPLGAIIDPTLAPNGAYRLEITASDGMSFPTTVSRTISLASDVKLGNFEIAFTDMDVAVAGFPLTVVRSYDSARAHQPGAFGFGWQLELPNTDLNVDIDPDSGFRLAQTAPYRDGTRVSITLPDGSVETFEFRPAVATAVPVSGLPINFLPDFVAVDNTSTLAVEQGVTLAATGSGTYRVEGAREYELYNPRDFGNAFLLTTRRGVEYLVNMRTGDLAELSDPIGNTLRFDGQGITSIAADGTRLGNIDIDYEWASWGRRIASITGPDNKQVLYEYDPLTGDLVTVTNRQLETTEFKYEDAARDHFLTGIVDSRGVEVLKPSFDPATGRLTSLQDASGAPANLNYNLDLDDGRTVETVSDSLGGKTEMIRDFQGNLLREVRHHKIADAPLRFEYLVTLFEYENGFQVRQSVPFTHGDPSVRLDFVPDEESLVWAQETTYAANGDVQTITDAARGVTTFRDYDSFGNPRTIIDAGSGITNNVYDDGNGNLMQTTDAEGNDTTFTYGSLGLPFEVLQTVEGQQVRVTKYEYDVSTGQPDAIVDGANFRREFVYNALNEFTEFKFEAPDPANPGSTVEVRTVSTRDNEGRITKTEQFIGGVLKWFTTTEFNSTGLITATTDRFGVRVESYYDVRGNLIETRTRSEDESGMPTWIVTRTVFDANERIIYTVDAHEELDPDNSPVAAPGTHTIYDTLGREVRVERLESITISLDDVTLSFPSSTETIFDTSESLVGDVLSFVETIYDGAGRVEQTIQSDGSETLIEKLEYDAAGRRTKHTQDLDGDLSSADDQIVIESFYDKAGREVRLVDPLGNTTHFEYDMLGQQTAIVQPATTDPDTGDRIHDHLRTEFVYDEFGRVELQRENISQGTPGSSESIDDPEVRETYYEYDVGGRLTAVVLPAADDPDEIDPEILTHPRFEYVYDVHGNVETIRDNIKQSNPLDELTIDYINSRTTTFTHDEENRQTSRTLPDGIFETNSYNELGQLELSIDFEDRHTLFEYDQETGRLASKKYFANSSSYDDFLILGTLPDEFIEYTYDTVGRERTTTFDPDGDPDATGDQLVTTKSYEPHGRLSQVDTPEGITNHAYDALGRLERTWTSKPGDVTDAITDTLYDYDSLGRLTTVTLVERNDSGPLPIQDQEVTTYQYDKSSNLEVATLPNGVVSDYLYDEMNRLTELAHSNSGGEFARYEYDFALDGNRTRAEEYNDSGLVAAFDWVYDDLGRLTREIYDGPGTADDFKALYYFDLVGNRDRKTVDADQVPGFEEDTRYTYDDNDRLLTEIFKVDSVLTKSTTYQYGVSNDRTELTQKRVDDVIAQIVEETDYTYNLQGRLEKVDIDADDDGFPESQITYRYNPDGIRVYEQVEEDPNSDGQIDQTTERHFVIDANNPTGFAQMLEEKSSPIALPDRSYTLGLDVIGQQAPGVENDNPFVYLYDGLGSVRGLIDPTGQPLTNEIYVYDAFGNPVGFNSAAALSIIQYRGEQTDGLTGFQYLRTRYLQSLTGTFTRYDEFDGVLRDPQTLHKLLYVHGDPINGIDPTGQFLVATISAQIQSIGARTQNARAKFAQTEKIAAHLYRHLVRATVLLNLSMGYLDQQLYPAIAFATPYQFQLLKEFSRHTRSPVGGKTARRILRVTARVGVGVAGRVAAEAAGFQVPIKANGMPDFSRYVHPSPRSTVFVKLQRTRRQDVSAADSARLFPLPAGAFTWHHHEIVGIMQLVPTAVNATFGHVGGRLFFDILKDNP